MEDSMLFKNRLDAGCQLGAALETLSLKEGLVIGLPRGGVVVAAEAARILHFPLDVIVPRKIGAPFNSELAIGAVIGNVVFLNEMLIQEYDISRAFVQTEVAKEQKEAARRLKLYRKGFPRQNFQNKTVILVDDGIATGSTMRVSIQYLQTQDVRRLIVAVPVAPLETVQKMKKDRIEIISLYSPLSFFAVGQFYQDFPQVEDEEVIKLLH
jgi:predicted phosphoribosyltransferase